MKKSEVLVEVKANQLEIKDNFFINISGDYFFFCAGSKLEVNGYLVTISELNFSHEVGIRKKFQFIGQKIIFPLIIEKYVNKNLFGALIQIFEDEAGKKKLVADFN